MVVQLLAQKSKPFFISGQEAYQTGHTCQYWDWKKWCFLCGNPEESVEHLLFGCNAPGAYEVIGWGCL